jgi:hypothetical protein
MLGGVMYQWTDEQRNAWLIKVRELLAFHFNEGELRSLCADLGIDYDDLPGSSKADKARELVLYCERHGRLDDLIKRCRTLRSNVDWPDPLPLDSDGGRKEYDPPKPDKYGVFSSSRSLIIVIGVIMAGLGVAFGYLILPKVLRNPPPTQTPTYAPNPAPTPAVIVVDTMDRLAGWTPVHESLSTVDLSLAPGMLNNAIQIDTDLGQEGWVLIMKEITPTLLSGTQSMRFYYMGTGRNTIELKLFYNADGTGEAFSYSRLEDVSTDDWVPFEQRYSAFVPNTAGRKLDPARVQRLEIAVSHQLGGESGRGHMIVDQIEALK